MIVTGRLPAYPVPSDNLEHLSVTVLSDAKFADVIVTLEPDRNWDITPTIDFLYASAIDAKFKVADPAVNVTDEYVTTNLTPA